MAAATSRRESSPWLEAESWDHANNDQETCHLFYHFQKESKSSLRGGTKKLQELIHCPLSRKEETSFEDVADRKLGPAPGIFLDDPVTCSLQQTAPTHDPRKLSDGSCEPITVKRGECGASSECKAGVKREIPEKNRRPMTSSASCGEVLQGKAVLAQCCTFSVHAAGASNHCAAQRKLSVFRPLTSEQSCDFRKSTRKQFTAYESFSEVFHVAPHTLYRLTTKCGDSLNEYETICRGATIPERLACSPPTKTKRVLFPAGSLSDFRKWESCQTMPLVGGFTWGYPISPTLAFQHCSILTSLHPHRSTRPHLDEIFTLRPKSPLWYIRVTKCFRRNPKWPPVATGSPPKPRAFAIPNQGHARIAIVQLMKRDHIDFNRVFGDEVMVSERCTASPADFLSAVDMVRLLS
ncbi:hypothetical protein PR048_024063 [Dryococelus australis]|uniref:Uncharacterized protein n=1 Tax=Dryococelus australis TaxID=614101 RepID=A0ABQ9GVU5_9NEOP|nr:hypothetical protein PR048_024063 [Dryococelus australis]